MWGRNFSGGNLDTFLSSLAEFCVDSVSTCFSHGADKLCVPIGLISLSVLLSLLSCTLLVHQRCRFRRESPGETITFLYSVLGNLSGTVGAVLSRQLHIQVLMATVAAAVDAVHFLSSCFLVLLCWNSKAERRQRMMRRRRRQHHLLAVCVLMVVAGGFLKSGVPHQPAERPLIRRKLLEANFEDNTYVLGYTLGLLSFVIACTSRFPALRRAHRGQMLTWPDMSSGLLCSLAGALYTAAILLYDTQFGFLLKILIIHWCRRGTRQQINTFSLDTESLLGGSHIPTEDKSVMRRQRKQQDQTSAQTKTKNVQQMTEVGRYMDVSIQPARQISLKEVMSNKEVDNKFLTQRVRGIRVDSLCSSDSSEDSSLVSSDLEWDFEEANARWREPAAKRQSPLQGWPTNPAPLNICTCAMSGLSHKCLSGTEEGDSVSPANFAK